MKLKKAMAIIMTAAMLASVPSTAYASGDTGILHTFQETDLDTRPMARMWFVDAMAGATDDDVIEEMILQMAEGGMGGVELAFLSDTPSITDVEFAKEYGWGSENWINILKKVFRAALKVESGFKVDLTITSHWPPALNTIDPNDTAASTEMSSSLTEITEEDIANGYVTLQLPETKTADGGGNPFIFTDTLVSASVTKSFGEREVTYVTEHPMMGTQETTSVVSALSYENMTDVSTAVSAEDGYAAGVPDAEALETWYEGAYTVDDIAARFGEAPAEDAVLVDGKRTEDGLRARMADTQSYYTLDLSELDVAAGDVVVSMFYRGTGQVRSGGGSYTMPYITYATNYFAEEGIQEVINYWENNILNDAELVELMAANAEKTGGLSIFEDSIEASHSTPFWSANMLQDGSEYLGYNMAEILPLVMSADSSSTFIFVDEEENQIDTSREAEDYDCVLTDLFNTEHMQPAKAWMDSLDFNVNYRIQAYGIESMGYVVGALTAGLPEGDNATAGDDDRMLSTAVNLNASNNLLSQEALTTIKQQLTWKIAAADVNNHSSSGINRVIFHGSSYPVCFDNNYNAWPGWNWGGMTNYYEGFNSWNSRTAWWDDANTITDYVSRLQAISQNGTAKPDIAILTNRDGSSSSFDALLDQGYSYNIMDEEVFREELVDADTLKVTDGVLCADTVGYRALVISDLEAITPEHLERVIGFAENGLPIVVQGTMPERTYGTASEDDAQVSELLSELLSMENVTSAETVEEAADCLMEMSVNPNASYNYDGIEATMREEESGKYYKLYNNSGDKAEFTVELTGDGIPYQLNLWDGTVEPIAAYEKTETGVCMDVTIEADEMQIIALASTDGELAAAAEFAGGENVTSIEEIVEETPGGGMFAFSFGSTETEPIVEEVAAKYVNNQLVIRATDSADYAVTTGTGNVELTTPEVKEVPDLYSWTLTLNSYGPDEEANAIDPTISKVETVEIENVAVGTAWAYLPTYYAEKLGVDNMDAISGVGVYKTTITMPENWDNSVDGAYLALTYCENDMLAGITVNGQEITDLNALHDYVDLGHLLTAGENEITIQIDTTLVNRGQYEGGQCKNPMDQRVLDGLMSAELIPYTDTVLK